MLYSTLSARMLPFAETRDAVQRASTMQRATQELREKARTGNGAARAALTAFEDIYQRVNAQALAKFTSLQDTITARKARAKRAARIRGARYMPV